MDLKDKKIILKQLVATRNDATQNAIEKEIDKASMVLNSESNYDELNNSLEILDIIAFRSQSKAVSTIKDFLARLYTLTLSYAEILGYPSETQAKFHNNNTLTIQAIKILENIRYHEPDKILDILFQYSTHEDESISKQAIKSLCKFVKFDLEIFYGDGDNWQGLGAQPQKKAVDKILSFNDRDKRKFFIPIISLCKEMLSPTISGTKWSYRTVTFNTSAISPHDEVKNIRRDTLEILKTIYPLASTPSEKKHTLRTMYEATQTPHQGDYSNEVLLMILDDTTNVLRFIKDTVVNENSEVIQSIEHDIYFLFRREGNSDIKSLSLEIKDIIDNDIEYQIFKILIGYEGIFTEWQIKDEEDAGQEYQRVQKLRQRMTHEYAESVTEENYPNWKNRILAYSIIDSNDLATFPYFSEFLQAFSTNSPTLAIKLIYEECSKLERFLASILLGLWQSSEKSEARKIVSNWIKSNSYLPSLARFLSFTDDFDEDLLKDVFIAAKSNNDILTLIQVISTVSSQYKGDNKAIIENLFIPAIQELTNHNNTSWIHDFWFRKEKSVIFSDMNDHDYEIILNNLLLAEEISYQHEEVLAEIAKRSPKRIIQFFCDRISKEKIKHTNDKYDAIPFSFQSSLTDQLSIIPEIAIDTVFNQYNNDYGFLIYREGRLLKNIFVDFPIDFSNKLIELIHMNNEKTTLFVLSILRNYDGDVKIQNVCKEIVKNLQDGDSLLNETKIALQSTGVVSGEYGFADAYKTKVEEIKPWLSDTNEQIKIFAKNYILDLENRIEYEIKRADENIILEKYQYGSDEDD